MRYPTSDASHLKGVPLGVFSEYEEADNYAGQCAQEYIEHVGYDVYFTKVELTSFYG